ncbi:MAG: 23S rRNA methyltransferase [Gammaproteobacteria bacterium]|nr:23S rRNA methyltransferase [Gammaproteobacteria bacterium]
MKRQKSRGRWLDNHVSDEYVQRARRDGYRSRACYKLMEIDDKHQILRSGITVVDLGAAPGSWSQLAAKRIGPAGSIIAIDILDMVPMPGVKLIKGDFTADSTLENLMRHLSGEEVDLVISDMAPNLSGMREIDQPRAMYLAELALESASRMLRPGGALLVKCFEGEGITQFRQVLSRAFKQLFNLKPKASRPKSREIYVLARGFKAR